MSYLWNWPVKPKRVVVGAAVGAAALLTVTACGSSGGGGLTSAPADASGTQVAPSGAQAAPSGTQSAASGGSNATLSAGQLASKTITVMKSATSFHVTAKGSTDGSALDVDMRYGAKSSKGTLTIKGVSIQLVSVGSDIYFKAPDSFWKQQVPASSQQQVLALVSGKWVKAPKSSSGFGELAQFADGKTFTAQLTSTLDPSTVRKGPSDTINGVDAVSFVDPAKKTTIYVAASGPPYPLKSRSSAEAGMLEFSDWQKPFSAEPPPADEVVDVSKLTG